MRKKFFTVKELCITALFTALTVILAQVIVPLPFTPVPVSFGLIAVYLSGLFLPPKCAIAAQVIYLLLGAIGLPVFGGFQGGIGRLLGPTGGCLVAYPFMAAAISFTLNRPTRLNIKTLSTLTTRLYAKAFLSVFAALAIIYVFGTLWLSIIMGLSFIEAAALMIAPFIVLDIIKVIATVCIFLPIRSQFLKTGLLVLPKKADQT